MTDRELDALVADKVMGWKPSDCPVSSGSGPYDIGRCMICNGTGKTLPKHYSTNIADAWLVVEKMHEKGSGYCLERAHTAPKWTVHFMPNKPQQGGKPAMILYIGDMEKISEEATSLPQAIVLAALKAVGVELPLNNATEPA